MPQSTLANSARVKIYTIDNPNIPADFEFIEDFEFQDENLDDPLPLLYEDDPLLLPDPLYEEV